MYDTIAYAARYGHQPLSEIFSRPRSQLKRFEDALSRLVEKENAKPPTE